MKLKILYFGMISELTNCSEEIISFEADGSVQQLQGTLTEKYPNLKKIQYKIAVDQSIAAKDMILSSTKEIALLPPFAGG